MPTAASARDRLRKNRIVIKLNVLSVMAATYQSYRKHIKLLLKEGEIAFRVTLRRSTGYRTPFTFAGGVGGAGVASEAFTESGNLSAFASKRLTCHVWVSVSEPWKPGMPVRRMPWATFQYVSPGSSSVTPFPFINSGGFGNMPWAMAVAG